MSTPVHTAWVPKPGSGGSFRKQFVNPTLRGLEMHVSALPTQAMLTSETYCVEEKVEFYTDPTDSGDSGAHLEHVGLIFEGWRERLLYEGRATAWDAEVQARKHLEEFDPGTVAWNGVSVVDPTVTEGWIEVDSMVEAADAGGDEQVGRAWDRRFRHPGKPGCLMTVYLYGVKVDNDAVAAGFELGVQKQVEYMICRDIKDPGGTEVECGYQYENLDDYNTLNSVEAAETEAHDWLKKLDAGDLSWDGVKV